MVSALSFTVPLVAGCALLLTISWSLDTSVPDGLPEKLSATLVDAVCRANWHFIKLFEMIGSRAMSAYWRETVFPSLLGVMVRGSPTFGASAQDPKLQVSDTLYSDIPVRVYEPVELTGKTNRPVLVFFHGGWASLGLDIYDPAARELAKRVSMVVVAVRFRMPPEHAYPAALEDSVKVTEHVINQAHIHDLDPNRVAVAGDGAGGQLAAAVSLKVKRLIKIQVLISPWLQLFDLQTPSYIENRKYLPGMRTGGDLLSGWMTYGKIPEEHLQDILENRHTSPTVKKSRYASYVAPYLYTKDRIRTEELRTLEKPNHFGDERVSEKLTHIITDPLFAPLMADDKDFRYVPSMAYIVTAGYDVTRDDGLIYWRRLKNYDVKAKLVHYEDGFHNMLLFAPVGSHSGVLQVNFDIGKRVLDNLIDYLLDNL